MGTVPDGSCPTWELSQMGAVPDGNCPSWELYLGNCPRWELSHMGTVPIGSCSRKTVLRELFQLQNVPEELSQSVLLGHFAAETVSLCLVLQPQ